MAIDPTALADEQVQRQALAAQGAPTEFAQGPEQAVRVAGPAAEGMRELLSRLSSSVQQSRPSGQPVRPPTPQEQGIVEDPGGLSMRGAAAEAAPEVLSDEGQHALLRCSIVRRRRQSWPPGRADSAKRRAAIGKRSARRPSH
jgi:hypothetical protein